jgi:hypothetical protein
VEPQGLANLVLVHIRSPISRSSVAFQLALTDKAVEVTNGYALVLGHLLNGTKFAHDGHIVPISDSVGITNATNWD